MSSADVMSLKAKLDKLLVIHQQLRDQNKTMRAAEAEWQAERSTLIQQNEIARRKVNEMIERLQTLERNSG